LDGKEFTLTAPTPPRALRAPSSLSDDAKSEAVRDAMQAALRGDFSELDKLELEFLNLLVRIDELFVKHADGTPHWWFDKRDVRYAAARIYDTHAPFVVGIRRGFNRDASSALEWALQEKCRRCDGKLRHLPCRVCDGRWYVGDMDDHELVYTDIDGVLIEERR
jgi:hypothetical protein